jgi:hypothetical protein
VTYKPLSENCVLWRRFLRVGIMRCLDFIKTERIPVAHRNPFVISRISKAKIDLNFCWAKLFPEKIGKTLFLGTFAS